MEIKKTYELEKPYKEWTSTEIYKAVVDYKRDHNLPKLQNASEFSRMAKEILRREFLTLSGVKDGHDIYKINTNKCKSYTQEDIAILLKKSIQHTHLKPHFPTTYIVEYIIETEQGFQIVQDRVKVNKYYRTFTGRDGKRHHLQERGCKTIEKIYP